MLVARTMLARLWFRDNDAAESNCDLNLPSSTNLDSALSFLDSWRQLVVAASSAACFEMALYIRRAENAPAGAAPSSDVLRHGIFIFGEDPDQQAVIRVPSIALGFLETSGPFAGIAIDQSSPAVISFVSAITDGLGGVLPCDPFAYDISSLSSAYKEQS